MGRRRVIMGWSDQIGCYLGFIVVFHSIYVGCTKIDIVAKTDDVEGRWGKLFDQSTGTLILGAKFVRDACVINLG